MSIFNQNLLSSPLWQKKNKTDFIVYLWCCNKAKQKNYQRYFRGKLRVFPSGTFTASRFIGSMECNIKPKTWYNSVQRLKKHNYLDTITDNHCTLIIVSDLYKKYNAEKARAAEKTLSEQ